MINFRFHLVSLVAVFLALGVGVAMGASFIDRATVDTMRDRVDQLEQRYRDRGVEIDDLRDELRQLDETGAALVEEGSPWIAGRLEDRDVVVITPGATPEAELETAWAPLNAAGANRSGTIRLTEAIELREEHEIDAAREVLGVTTGSQAALRSRLIEQLADALALLSVAPVPSDGGSTDGTSTGGTSTGGASGTGPSNDGTDPGANGTTTQPGAAGPATTGADEPNTAGAGDSSAGTGAEATQGTSDAAPSATELADARAVVESLAGAGFIEIDLGGAPGDAAFPDVEDVRYVVVLGVDPAPPGLDTALELTTTLAEASPGTATVAEMSGMREDGEIAEGDEEPGAALAPLRDDPSLRVSTVDRAGSIVGRMALVLAVQEQYEGEVGHYGSGGGTSGLFPDLPPA